MTFSGGNFNTNDDPALLSAIIDTVGDGIYCVDTERRIFFWNKAAERITGYTAEEMIGKQCFESRLDHIDKDGRPLCDLLCPLVGTIFDGKTRQEKVLLRHKDGHRVPVVVNTFPLEDNAVTIGAMEIFQDCLPPVYDGDFVQALAQSMMHDELTGLPNRTYLNNFIAYKLRENKSFTHSFVLVFAEIENFRELERELGVAEMQRVMKRIAEKLGKCARRNDLIGRWSDDRFLGVFSGAGLEDERVVGGKLQLWLEEVNPEMPEGRGISVSIGVTAVQPDDTIDTLIERADRNMFAGLGAPHDERVVTDSDKKR